MRQEKPKKIHQAQQGFVLIIVVSILTVILGFIAIGFSKLSSRELIQASHRESAAQAYYAAQSGINDAVAYIKDGGSSFPGCTWPSSGNSYFTTDLSGISNIAKYSCISVDKTPKSLTHTVPPGTPWIVKVDASNLSQLHIGWENSPHSGSPAFFNDPDHPLAFGTLPDETSSGFLNDPNQTGVLRTQIYKVDRNSPPVTNSDLATGSRVYYLYPYYNLSSINCHPNNPDPKKGCVDFTQGGYSVASGPSNPNGIFVSGMCKQNPSPGDQYCNSAIKGFDSNYYYLYFTAQYSTLNVVISGTDSDDKPVQFTGAQAVVDVTGQSADQIQRVRARISLTDQFNAPNYAVQSMESLCKTFTLQILTSTTYGVAQGVGPGLDSSGCITPSGGGSIGNPVPGELSGH